MTSDLPTLAGIVRAERVVRAHLPETPLVRSELLSRALEADVWLKNETVSPIASFKLRGALAALHAAITRGAAGAVTSSTGNHGQGVACAARLLGLTAEVFLPVMSNPVKRAMIAAFGATTHQRGRDLDDAKELAIAHAESRGLAFIDDGESLPLMEGAGTVGLEIGRTLGEIDCVFVPMGSGTLVAGIAAALTAIAPRARVVAVQAKGSPAMVESFHAGRCIECPADTIAEGLMCRVPAALALAALLAYVDDVRLASDNDLLSGVRTLAELGHVLVEPAGAAALAGALGDRHAVRGRRIVLVLTGGNVTLDQLSRALSLPPLIAAPWQSAGAHPS